MPDKHHTVHNPVAAASGNLKLRGLLQTSRELLRKRQIKRALNNAQIAQDFAVRSGEAPGIAAAARLLTAEIYLLNASYTYDDGLRRQGWRLIEQLEADGLRGQNIIDGHELTRTKAVGLRRLGEYESAAALLLKLRETLSDEHPLKPYVLVDLVATIAQHGEGPLPEVLAEAEHAVPLACERDQPRLLAHISLARAYAAMMDNEVSKAIDYAHRAARMGRQAEAPETQALANYFVGKLSRRRGNEGISLRFLYEALDAAERMGYRALLIDAHLAIGHVYESLNNHREADKYFDFVATESLDVERADTLFEASLALGRSALSRKQYDPANKHLAMALQAAKQEDWVYRQGVALGELAHLKYREEHSNLAGHLLAEARRCFEQVPERKPAPEVALGQAQLALDADQLDACIAYAEEGLVLAKAVNRNEHVVTALRLMARAYEYRGDVADALRHQREATTLAVSLFHTQRDRQLPDLNMRAALRKQEEQIRELTREADLKKDLYHKNEEIERANRELVQANEELRQFAYVASHDLKEPVRQIGSYVSLIRRKYHDSFDESGQSFFSFVTEGVTRLNGLLDSLMRYTSVARIDEDVSAVNLNEMVGGVERELSTLVEQSKARISYQDLPTVHTTGKILRHVLHSVLHNALKFKQPEVDTKVQIRVHEEGESYQLAIQDNGIGIQDKYNDKVFVLFQMLQAKTEYEGTGVGLAIAQKAVQRLGGRIWYEANQDGSPGVTFCVTLPKHDQRTLPLASSEELPYSAQAA